MCSHDVRHGVCYSIDTSVLRLWARGHTMYIPSCTTTCVGDYSHYDL